MKITDFINGEVFYDNQDQEIFIKTPDGGIQKFLELRGWGKIQNMFMNNKGQVDLKSAGDFQDEIGKFVEDAINEKLKRESNKDFNLLLLKQLKAAANNMPDEEFLKLCDEYNKIGEDFPVTYDLFPCYLSDVEFKKSSEKIDEAQNLNNKTK